MQFFRNIPALVDFCPVPGMHLEQQYHEKDEGAYCEAEA
jgi:hypothetical protein